jgi:hypothetical protein
MRNPITKPAFVFSLIIAAILFIDCNNDKHELLRLTDNPSTFTLEAGSVYTDMHVSFSRDGMKTEYHFASSLSQLLIGEARKNLLDSIHSTDIEIAAYPVLHEVDTIAFSRLLAQLMKDASLPDSIKSTLKSDLLFQYRRGKIFVHGAAESTIVYSYADEEELSFCFQLAHAGRVFLGKGWQQTTTVNGNITNAMKMDADVFTGLLAFKAELTHIAPGPREGFQEGEAEQGTFFRTDRATVKSEAQKFALWM